MATAAESSTSRTRQPKQTGVAAVGVNQVDNTFRLTTPENISFQYRLAGPFRRLFPYLLDLIIVFGAFWAMVWVIAVVSSMLVPLLLSVGLGIIVDLIGAVTGVLILVGLFLTYWFYGTYFETNYNGRTFGKMAGGLRVLSKDGHAIDGVQATLRNFFRLVDLMPMLPLSALLEIEEISSSIGLPTALFGLVVMSVSPRFQRLGDLVAGTMVVIKESPLNPDIKSFEDPRVPKLAELIPDSFYVSSSLGRAIAEYVQRRERLGVGRAGEIASKLAGRLLKEFSLPRDTDADLLICSLYYKVFVGVKIEDEGGVEPTSIVAEQVEVVA